jgi:nucleoside 2-deoxyribosyltransferase
MIYLASPYTHIDPAVRQRRFESACRAAAALICRGQTVFSPIAHSHVICSFGVPLDWRFWARHDRRYLEVCDEMVVLMLDGWRESIGVQAEIAIARELGKPVSFLAANDEAKEDRNTGRDQRQSAGLTTRILQIP